MGDLEIAMVSRTAATFIALFVACCFAESIQKTVCVPNTDKCVNIEYEPCTTELVIGGNLIPGDGVSLSLASNVSKCVDVDTSQIIDIAGSLGVDTSQLEVFEQFNPQICIALSDVHVEDGEKASFNFKVYIHASKKVAGFQIPDFVLPGMDRSYDLGHLCYGKSAASCNGACGYCADSGTCMLGNRDGPLCKTCSSSDGKLVTTYRKRATQGNVTTPGERPCCFDTKFGKVGVMICYDAENQQFLQEALAMKPVLMLNPIHISAGALSNSNSNRERHAQWRTSLESMGRYIDRVVSKENGQVTWIRCDQPYPIGAGTSQITSGCRTQQVSTSGTTNWSVLVEIGSKSPAPRWICRAPTRDRTLDIDNCGNRYTLKNIEIALHEEMEGIVY